MLSRNRLIQRLRSACSQRRLFSGDRGAIAASLIEIGVAMLAVGILTAGAVTTFTGFIDSASDTTARGRLNDAASTSDQVYNWLRPGGERCFSDTDCTNTDASAVAALQEAAGGQLTFAAWPLSAATSYFEDENTIYIQVETPSAYANTNEATAGGTYATAAATGNHNGIAGDPDDGQWIRIAIRSDSGSTFCVVKVAQTNAPGYEGVGYKSVNSASSADPDTTAHCGGHNGSGAATSLHLVTAMSCVFGSGGESTGLTPVTGHQITDGVGLSCDNSRALGRPGAGTDIDP